VCAPLLGQGEASEWGRRAEREPFLEIPIAHFLLTASSFVLPFFLLEFSVSTATEPYKTSLSGHFLILDVGRDKRVSM
jgi:hypothetical protein